MSSHCFHGYEAQFAHIANTTPQGSSYLTLTPRGRLALTLWVWVELTPVTEIVVKTVDCNRRTPPGESRPHNFRTYTGRLPTDREFANLRDEFVSSIKDVWNESLYLWPLRHAWDRYNRLDHGLPQEIDCLVELDLRPTPRPHLRAQVLCFPDNEESVTETLPIRRGGDPRRVQRMSARALLGGASNPLGTEMWLAWRGPGSLTRTLTIETSDRGDVEITQNAAAHEFGHYLGHNHTCQRPVPIDGGQCDLSQYCIPVGNHAPPRRYVETASLMAAGNEMRSEYATKWQEALAQHHYFCHVPFHRGVHRTP